VQSYTMAGSRQQQYKMMIERPPLHRSTDANVSLAMLWELLCFDHGCVTIQDSDGRTALKHLEEEMRPNKMKSNARMQR
jgi:hypothetical protein